MAFVSRLDQLRELVQPDIDALPDRPLSSVEAVSDDDAPGGVSLGPPFETSPADIPSKQTTSTNADSSTKPATAAIRYLDCQFDWAQGFQKPYKIRSIPHSSAPPISITKPPAVTNLQLGDLVSAHQHFTPIQALAKYPYRFCSKEHRQSIASAFFDQGKFWEREWDLYYVWDIEVDTRPIILVLESQFQDLLTDINNYLQLGLTITDEQRSDSLVAQFPDHPRCLPRYLGRSHSREEYDNMLKNAPGEDFRAAGEPTHPPLVDRSLEDFKKLMEELWDVQKAKNKAARAKKQQERLHKQKYATDQFKRAQRYLGLRPGGSTGELQSGTLGAIDCSRPVSFSFEKSVVFVCVDVESYERAHSKITEIGIATLDTRELVGVPPGEDGAEWRKLIRARHFRIKEHAHLVNYKFVVGRPDSFDFGESTFVPLKDAVSTVEACFRPPFGAQTPNSSECIVDLLSGIDLNEKRNIIFLGHNTKGDIQYLLDLGFDAMSLENMIEPLDTTTLYSVWKRDQQPASLGKILYDFDIAGFNLHNAGNDAVFTVQAMLGVCVREASIRGPELNKIRDEEAAARVAAALEDAKQKVKDETEGWSDHEADGDGGPPVPMQITPKAHSLHDDATAHNHPKHTIGLHSPQSRNIDGNRGGGRGGGRGRGGTAEPFRGSDYRPRGGRNQHVDNYNGSSDYVGNRGRGKAQHDGRGRGYGRGHGRGYNRGNFDANNTQDSDANASQPQVYWW